MKETTHAMREIARAAAAEKWTQHVTSSGVRIEIYDDGEVTISNTLRNSLLLTPTQWRELAAYAMTKFDTCTNCDPATSAAS